VSDEPTGRTIDGTPWEEPRPPHLPDRLTAVTPWLLPFAAVAGYQFWLLWVDQPRESGLGFNLQYWLDARYQIPAIASSMIGLALFNRHPDARRTLPQVASGAFLLALEQVMTLFQQGPLSPWLASTVDYETVFSPVSQGYDVLRSLVLALGIAFLASGLSAARRYESPGLARALPLIVSVSAFVSAGFSVLGLTFVQFDVSPAQVFAIAGTLVGQLLGTLALGYLVVVTLTGWLGQESPRSGWRLAAIASGLILLARLFAPAMSLLFPAGPAGQDVLLAVGQLVVTGSIIGWIGLLLAFVVGLPSTTETSGVDGSEDGATIDQTASTTRDSAAG